MASEEITIDLGTPDQRYFAALDQRFADAAKKFGDTLKASVGAGTGGGGPGAPGGGGGGGSGGKGFGARSALAAINGAGQGIASTPAGALGSPLDLVTGTYNAVGLGNDGKGMTAMQQNAAIGAVGGLLKETVGKVPILGDYVTAQWNAFEQGVKEPAARAEGKLGAFYGDLAAHGINVSDKEIDRNAHRALAAERRRLSAERRVQRITEEANAQTGAVTYSLGLIGI